LEVQDEAGGRFFCTAHVGSVLVGLARVPIIPVEIQRTAFQCGGSTFNESFALGYSLSRDQPICRGDCQGERTPFNSVFHVLCSLPVIKNVLWLQSRRSFFKNVSH